jgi:hypothetical protein
VVKLRAVAVLSFGLIALGQESGKHYDALKQALGLNDAQLSQLQQKSQTPISRPALTGTPALVAIYPPVPADGRPMGRFFGSASQPAQNEDALRVLDDSQRTKLAEIKKVLDRWGAAELAIEFGLIREQQWPGGAQCPVRSSAYAMELGLSEFQIREFEQLRHDAQEPLWAQIREKEARRMELLDSGVGADSPAVVELISDVSRLQAQIGKTGPPHDPALAVLDSAQRANLAAFETALQLAGEAIDLGLIPKPAMGEFLCH